MPPHPQERCGLRAHAECFRSGHVVSSHRSEAIGRGGLGRGDNNATVPAWCHVPAIHDPCSEHLRTALPSGRHAFSSRDGRQLPLCLLANVRLLTSAVRKQMYNDILFSGARRFMVTNVDQQTGRMAEVGVVFFLDELKEASRYICLKGGCPTWQRSVFSL